MKKQNGTSSLATIPIAMVSVFVGLLLGVAYMASIPAQGFANSAEYEEFLTDRTLPSEPRPGDVGYFEGTEVPEEEWVAKREALLAGAGTVELTAAELNGWFSSTFEAPQAPAEDGGSIVVSPGMPVFYIEDGVLHLSFGADVATFGKAPRNYRVITRGQFEAGDAGPRFVPEALYVGNARLPLLSNVTDKVFEVIRVAFGQSPEYKVIEAAYAQVERIELQDDRMRVVFK